MLKQDTPKFVSSAETCFPKKCSTGCFLYWPHQNFLSVQPSSKTREKKLRVKDFVEGWGLRKFWCGQYNWTPCMTYDNTSIPCLYSQYSAIQKFCQVKHKPWWWTWPPWSSTRSKLMWNLEWPQYVYGRFVTAICYTIKCAPMFHRKHKINFGLALSLHLFVKQKKAGFILFF